MTAPQQRRIALVRLGALGDVVLLSSLTQALAAADWQVTLVTDHKWAPLVHAMPGVARVVDFVRARHDSLGALWRLGRSVGPVDVVVDLQRKPRTIWLARAIEARQRLALQLRTPWQTARKLLGHDAVRTDAHQTLLNLEVVRHLVDVSDPPRPRLELAPVERSLVTLVPGAAHGAKRWPAERFGQLARALQAHGHALAIIVGPGERPLRDAIAAACARPLRDTLGQGVDAVIAVCQQSRLVIAGDTGPAHVAAALDVPVVSMFGPTSEVRWRPVGPGTLLTVPLPCRPCSNHGVERCPLGHQRCLLDLGVGTVLDAAQALVRTAP